MQYSGADALILERELEVYKPAAVKRGIDQAPQSINDAFNAVDDGERRGDVRLSVRNAFVIYQVAGDRSRRRTHLVDILQGGLGFFSTSSLDLDCALKLHLQLPVFLKPERIVGKVTSCAAISLGDGGMVYRIGVAYSVDVSNVVKPRLSLLQMSEDE